MPFKYCQHIKENGASCRSAAMRGRNYCYFHARLRARRLGMAKCQAEGQVYRLSLPPLEDMHSVQSALMQVLDAVAAGAIDSKRAGLLLYGLQQAASNIKAAAAWMGPSRFQMGRSEEDGAAVSAPALEKEFSLPAKFDLDTVPEVAFPLPPSAPLRMEAEQAFVTAYGTRDRTHAPQDNVARAPRPPKRPPSSARLRDRAADASEDSRSA